jgi:RNA polymerase sigma-70 factor, ECF subfamily
MTQPSWVLEEFEANRAHLRAVAFRMLGSPMEADDALQECWLRVSRADASVVDNLGGWLTTILSRVCLDMLRSRTSRREELAGDELPEATPRDNEPDPEREAVLADAVGSALLVILQTLSPAERLSFVLHDMFAVPFEEIAPILDRSPAATRQLASRARRRVQGADAPETDPGRKRQVVAAFLAASREGSFDELLALLDPEVVLRSDSAAVASGADPELVGASAVAQTFCGRAQGARLALIDGLPGAVWAQGGTTRVVFDFIVVGKTIAAIDVISDPEILAALELEFLRRSGEPGRRG